MNLFQNYFNRPTHPTKARAELSADLIKRVAERDIGGPVHG